METSSSFDIEMMNRKAEEGTGVWELQRTKEIFSSDMAIQPYARKQSMLVMDMRNENNALLGWS